MKKLLSILMVTCLALTMTACGDTSKPDETEGVTQSQEETAKSSDVKIGDDIQLDGGKYAVKINSLRRGEDVDGKPCVIVNYSFVNNSEETTSAIVATHFQVFQDGTELESAIMMDGINPDNVLKDIRPNNSIDDCELGYVMTSENELEIEVSATSELLSGNKILINAEVPK